MKYPQFPLKLFSLIYVNPLLRLKKVIHLAKHIFQITYKQNIYMELMFRPFSNFSHVCLNFFNFGSKLTPEDQKWREKQYKWLKLDWKWREKQYKLTDQNWTRRTTIKNITKCRTKIGHDLNYRMILDIDSKFYVTINFKRDKITNRLLSLLKFILGPFSSDFTNFDNFHLKISILTEKLT